MNRCLSRYNFIPITIIDYIEDDYRFNFISFEMKINKEKLSIKQWKYWVWLFI
jgi:hypothetical protein